MRRSIYSCLRSKFGQQLTTAPYPVPFVGFEPLLDLDFLIGGAFALDHSASQELRILKNQI